MYGADRTRIGEGAGKGRKRKGEGTGNGPDRLEQDGNLPYIMGTPARPAGDEHEDEGPGANSAADARQNPGDKARAVKEIS